VQEVICGLQEATAFDSPSTHSLPQKIAIRDGRILIGIETTTQRG